MPGFHAFSFFLEDGSPCVDLLDSSAKCMLDVLPPPDKANVLKANSTSGAGGGPSEHFVQWIQGRPDLDAMSKN